MVRLTDEYSAVIEVLSAFSAITYSSYFTRNVWQKQKSALRNLLSVAGYIVHVNTHTVTWKSLFTLVNPSTLKEHCLVTWRWSNVSLSRSGYAVVARVPNVTARDQCLTKLKMTGSWARAHVACVAWRFCRGKTRINEKPHVSSPGLSRLRNLSLRAFYPDKTVKPRRLVLTCLFIQHDWRLWIKKLCCLFHMIV